MGERKCESPLNQIGARCLSGECFAFEGTCLAASEDICLLVWGKDCAKVVTRGDCISLYIPWKSSSIITPACSSDGHSML